MFQWQSQYVRVLFCVDVRPLRSGLLRRQRWHGM